MNEAGDKSENRSARYRKAKLLADIIGVRPFAFPIARAKRLRQMRASAGIPAFVDAVQYARQLLGVRAALQQTLEPATELTRRDLLRIGRADSRQMRGVDDATLEEG